MNKLTSFLITLLSINNCIGHNNEKDILNLDNLIKLKNINYKENNIWIFLGGKQLCFNLYIPNKSYHYRITFTPRLLDICKRENHKDIPLKDLSEFEEFVHHFNIEDSLKSYIISKLEKNLFHYHEPKDNVLIEKLFNTIIEKNKEYQAHYTKLDILWKKLFNENFKINENNIMFRIDMSAGTPALIYKNSTHIKDNKIIKFFFETDCITFHMESKGEEFDFINLKDINFILNNIDSPSKNLDINPIKEMLLKNKDKIYVMDNKALVYFYTPEDIAIIEKSFSDIQPNKYQNNTLTSDHFIKLKNINYKENNLWIFFSNDQLCFNVYVPNKPYQYRIIFKHLLLDICKRQNNKYEKLKDSLEFKECMDNFNGDFHLKSYIFSKLQDSLTSYTYKPEDIILIDGFFNQIIEKNKAYPMHYTKLDILWKKLFNENFKINENYIISKIEMRNGNPVLIYFTYIKDNKMIKMLFETNCITFHTFDIEEESDSIDLKDVDLILNNINSPSKNLDINPIKEMLLKNKDKIYVMNNEALVYFYTPEDIAIIEKCFANPQLTK
jgi:hypothetical protein